MPSRSVMVDFALFALLVFCVAALSLLAWRTTSARGAFESSVETFSPRLVDLVP